MDSWTPLRLLMLTVPPPPPPPVQVIAVMAASGATPDPALLRTSSGAVFVMVTSGRSG